MGRDHIKVSTHELADMASQLQRLQDEFEHSSNIVDSFRGYLGSGTVAGKMDSFATNWSIHREALCKQMKALATLADDAAKAYDGVDAHLASALEKAYGADANKIEGS